MIWKRKRPGRGGIPWPYSMFSDQSGQVMPVAVVALAILFLICMMIIVVAIGELRISTLAKESLRAYRIAEAGVNRAMNELRIDTDLTSPDTANPNLLNWPPQALAGGAQPEPTDVHQQSFGSGEYEVWLYQDPVYPTDHSKKVIVSYGQVTESGDEISRTIQTRVDFQAENPNAFDAFNFLVYQGDEDDDGGDVFEVDNSFGSYELNGIGAGGDGWGIYSKGPIELHADWFGWDCNVVGNVISEDYVKVGSVASLAPLDIHGTVYAGIDNEGPAGDPTNLDNCDITCNVNFFAVGDMYVGKVYAADDVNVETICQISLLGVSGAMDIDLGIECGGSVDILGVASGGVFGGGIDIGHAGNGPTDGIKAGDGVEADAWLTDMDIGDIECGYDVDGGQRVGINFDAAALGNIGAGDIETVGYVDLLGAAGYIHTRDIWAGVKRNDGVTQDSLSVQADGVVGGFQANDIVARGRVDLMAAVGGFDVGNIWAGYEYINTGLPLSWQRRGVDILAVLGGFDTDDIYSFGEVDADLDFAAGGSMGDVEAGTDALDGNGGNGVDVLVIAGGIGIDDVKCRGKANMVFGLAGAGVGDIHAGTENAGGHGGTGINIVGAAGGANVGDCTCTGRLDVTSVAAVVDVDDCVVGTNSTTLVNGMGTGGDGIAFNTGIGGITADNITSRGRVPLMPIVGFISTGNIIAGTNNPTGNGGTGVNITGAVNVVTTGSITSRGMVDILCAVNVVTTGNIVAGTNSATASSNKLVGGTGVNIVGGVAVPVLGGITSHGKVNITTGAAIVTIGGAIYAGTDQTNANEYGGTGVNISTGAGGVTVNGGITSRGIVDLWALVAWIDVNGRVTAGTNNTSGNGGVGVDINPLLAQVDTNGITSRGRCDLQAIGAGIYVHGTMDVGTNSGTGWGGVGIDADSTLGVIDVSGLTRSRGVVTVQSTASFGCDFAGIYAGGINTTNGYGGTGIDVRAYAAGVDIDGGGSLKTPGKIYLDTVVGSIDVDGDVVGGSDSDSTPPIAGGTGVHMHPRLANISTGGLVYSTGRTWLDLDGIGGSFSSCTVNGIIAGSDNGLSTGVGIKHSMGGIFNDTRINNTWYVGRLEYDTGVTSSLHLGNIYTGHPVEFNPGGWSGMAAAVIEVFGYIGTPSYVSLKGDGLTVNLNDGIHCGGNVVLEPEAGFFGGAKTYTIQDSVGLAAGAIESGGSVTLKPVHEGAKDNKLDIRGMVWCNSLALDARNEVVEIKNDSYNGGIKVCSSVSINADGAYGVWPVCYSSDQILITGSLGITALGDITLSNQEGNLTCTQSGNLQITGGIKATGKVTVDYNAGGTIGCAITAEGANSNIDYDNPGTVSGLIHCKGPFTVDARGVNGDDTMTLNGGLKTSASGAVNCRTDYRTQSCFWALVGCFKSWSGNAEKIQINSGRPPNASITSSEWRDYGASCGSYWSGCPTNTTGYWGGTSKTANLYANSEPVVTDPVPYSCPYPGPEIPACPDPVTDLGISLPDNPPIHGTVDNIYTATSGSQEDLQLPAEPALPTFGNATYPYFPDQTQAASDLPGWMNYSCSTVTDVATSTGTTGLIPDMPEHPEWNGEVRPDWSTLLPFGAANEVKFPRPQWDWWRKQAKEQGNYYADDAVISINSNCSDEIFFAEGDVTISAMDFTNGTITNQATILAYGHGVDGDGDITVNNGVNWRIFSGDQLHLMANDDITLTPSSVGGLFSLADNSVYQFWAGDEIHIALGYLGHILGSGKTLGNFVAGNEVELTDTFDLGIGWYQFEYVKPEIKADGWVIPFRTRSWRELTKANWK